jgi:hypothetical protein
MCLSGTRYRWAATQFPESGQVQERIRKHCETHERAGADDWLDNVTVARRGSGGYDIRGWTSAE